MACGESEAAVSDIILLFIIIIISIGSDHLQVFWRIHTVSNAIVKPKQAHYQPATWSCSDLCIYQNIVKSKYTASAAQVELVSSSLMSWFCNE